MVQDRPRKGDRYAVTTAFTTILLVQFFAPFTGGNEQTLPAGLLFVIDHDAVDSAKGVAAIPEPYADWEPALVSDVDRKTEKYAGYYLVIKFDDLEKFCEKVVAGLPPN